MCLFSARFQAMHFELCEIWFRALLLNVEINCYEAANHEDEEVMAMLHFLW